MNFLKLNGDKTELLVVRPPTHRNVTEEICVNVDGCSITESQNIRNLGVIFDSQLTFKPHIKAATKTAFYHLSNIAKIRSILSSRDAETLIHSFVSSRLDYCNALFSGLPKCVTRGLQLAQNAAARILTKTKRFDHITPVLMSLHWLPIVARADFKILLLTFKALNGLAPLYLSELLLSYSPPRPLRSADAGLLVIPSTKRSAGKRAFASRAPFLWNNLPRHIREAGSLDIFKSTLKTFLFSKHYGV